MKNKPTPIHLTNILLYLTAIGFILFFLISSSAPFDNAIFRGIFPKNQPSAEDILKTPGVELFINYKNQKTNGILNIEKNDPENIYLSWQTSGKPESCYGWSSGKNFEDGSWEGEKDVNGGSFVLPKFTESNAFVYSIECHNEYGDAQGDSVTVNVGAQSQLLAPYMSSVNLYAKSSEKFDPDKPVTLAINQEIGFQWEMLNTLTPYSVCVVNGSWPTRYRNSFSSSLIQKQQLTELKIHHFTIYCSNEIASVKKSITIIGVEQ